VLVKGYMTLGQLAPTVDEALMEADGIGFRGQVREVWMIKAMEGDAAYKIISNMWLFERGL
jgi:hypothetical protein